MAVKQTMAAFALTDVVRRAEGDVFDLLGLGPRECEYRIAIHQAFWRLREYAVGADASPPLLIVAAPIKRPYIWDLAPSASPIRFCLQRGVRLHLLEWLESGRRSAKRRP
jgi:polyhydroxyalkanoate synthase